MALHMYGGRDPVGDARLSATKNTVTLAGLTTVGGDVFGGYSNTASLGAADFTIGNKLYVRAEVPVGGSVGNFETLDFTLPAGFAKGDVMLTVGGNATFRSDEVTGVSFSFAGTPPALNAGDRLTLIAATGTMTIKLAPDAKPVSAGGHEFKVEQVGNTLVATVLPPHTYTARIYPDYPPGAGRITCDPERVSDGGKMTCTAVAGDGWGFRDGSFHLSSGSATPSCSGNTCTLLNITSDVELSASFGRVHTITPTVTPAGSGTITCTPNPALYSEHDPVICTATANAGFVYVDGSLKLDSGYAEASCSGNKCELLRIESDLRVSASFRHVAPPGTHAITATATPAEGGSVTCTPATVVDGKDVSITCTPTANSGYKFSSLALAGGSCSGTTCSAKAVRSELNVVATFIGSSGARVVSIDGNTGNTTLLQPGKANAVAFSVTADGKPVDGSGTLTITDVTKSRGVEKAAFDGGAKSTPVTIARGEFSENITPEASEKTVEVELKVGETTYYFTFTVAGSSGGGPSPVPTLGEVGLLLSGIALAGAAAPALRRREKQGKKADTRQ